MLAVRREAITWRRAVAFDTPQGYWSYLRRYRDGPHAWDARRRLAMLHAEFDAPSGFALVDFGVPPPPPAELGFIAPRVLIFAGDGFAPPPRPPVLFLPERPRAFTVLPPPPAPPPHERFGLPLPTHAVLPVFVTPPHGVARAAPSGGAAPGAGAKIPVSLPNAVQHGGTSAPAGAGATNQTPGAGGINQPPGGGSPNHPPHHPGSASPTAAVKPAPVPAQQQAPGAGAAKLAPTPPHGATTSPAAAKPGPTPPHAAPTTPAAAKPAPLPPHAAPIAPAAAKPGPTPPHVAPLAPAAAKPAPLPPHAAPVAPAVAKPAPPARPSPPAAAAGPAAAKPVPAAKPACPPGKHQTPEGCK